MLFEKASRLKFRFPSTKGPLTVEQLWDLPLQSRTGFDLDNVAKAINAEVKAETEESFVTPRNSERKTQLQEALSIVVHIIETKQTENAKARDAAARKAERDQLVEILHSKKLQEASSLSTEELQRRIDALSG